MTREIIAYIIIGALAALVAILLLREHAAEKRRRIQPTWSPFGADGKLRDDLLAVKKIDGQWVPNPQPNEGFYPLGSIRED